MVSGFISRIVILIFGTLYPAYASYKAVRTKNVKEYVKWMMYWIVFALFTCAETFTDLFLSFWFPFYYEIKIITVIYLLSPATKGSSILYRKFVHPVLTKREQEIDEYIAKAKEQGYHTMLNLGSKGVTYATSLIMQTAIKGSNGLVSQLKKSYSLNDLSEEQNTRRKEPTDVPDNPYNEEPRLIRRNTAQSLREKNMPLAGLYFPEFDVNYRPGEEYFYRQVPSSEEISLGYSSGESLGYDMQGSKDGHLVRTASLGPSSRVRTRATTKYGLPKRSSLSEGGSTWSAMESHESQKETETDNVMNFPFSHSASLPFPLSPLQPFLPEYQRVFGNFTQNQILTLTNNSPYPTMFFKQNIESKNNSGDALERENERSNNFSIVVSDGSSIKPKNQTEKVVIRGKLKNVEEKKEVLIEEIDKNADKIEFVGEKTGEDAIEKKESPEKVAEPYESLDVKERSGKYNKKPAPTPPIEELKVTNTSSGVEEEAEFHTPNASPKLERKNNSNVDLSPSYENNGEPHDSNFLEVPVKPKWKSKKKDFKLHMPKMSFSFWHQKSGKHSSASESSSVASVEIATTQSENKSEVEYFIPLKDDDDNKSEETSKVEESKN